MFKRFDRFCNSLSLVYGGLGVIFLLMIVISLFIQVFTRYILNSSASWTEEFARFCFIWFTMCGAPVATGKGLHASITILSDKLKGKVGMAQKILVHLLVMVVVTIVGIAMIPVMITSANRLSAALTLPYCYVYLAVPVGCIGIIVQSLNSIVKLVSKTDAMSQTEN